MSINKYNLTVEESLDLLKESLHLLAKYVLKQKPLSNKKDIKTIGHIINVNLIGSLSLCEKNNDGQLSFIDNIQGGLSS